MKSSYKLIGVQWDRLPVPKTLPQIEFLNDNVPEYTEEFTLLDSKCFRRRIKITDFLKAESLDDVEDILFVVKNCDEVLIEIDYFPRVNESAVVSFYTKRVLQMIQYILNKCECQQKKLVISSQNRAQFEKYADCAYGKCII